MAIIPHHISQDKNREDVTRAGPHTSSTVSENKNGVYTTAVRLFTVQEKALGLIES